MQLAYEGFDAGGKAVSAVIDAGSPDEAIETLRGRGVFVTTVVEARRGGGAGAEQRRGRRSLLPKTRTRRLKQLSVFTRQLHVLTSTGTPILQALEALEKQASDPTWRETVAEVREQIESGTSLAEAMAARPEAFGEIYRSLIHAGESSGKLSVILDRLASLTQRQLQTRSTVIGALAYPAVLLTVAGGVLLLMLAFVLPRFATLFTSLEVPLPPTTAALLAFGTMLRAWWWAVLIALVGGAVGLRYYLRSPAGKRQVDTLLLRLPVVGGITRSFATARVTRLMGTLIDSYLPLLDVLGLLKKAAGNLHYATLIGEVEQAVTRGDPMSSALEGSPLIPPSVVEAIRSGEGSGQLAPTLLSLSAFLDEENEVVIKTAASILEPVILVILGLFVGAVALSIFLPMFDLAASGGGV